MEFKHASLTTDSAEILAMRLILRALVDEVAGGLARDPKDFRSQLQRQCVDQIEGAGLTMAGELEAEDFRTQWMAVVASMLGG